jgi:hypothetical protein
MPSDNPAFDFPWFVLVLRGGCSFDQKSRNMQNLGASGVIGNYILSNKTNSRKSRRYISSSRADLNGARI